MIGHCKDCRWFRDTVPINGVPGTCAKAETYNHTSPTQFRDTLAAACDNECYHAYLIVDPEFGCVQFEKLGTE